MWHVHAGKLAAPMIFGMPEIHYLPAIQASQQILLKITTSHFNALNMQIANQNVLEKSYFSNIDPAFSWEFSV